MNLTLLSLLATLSFIAHAEPFYKDDSSISSQSLGTTTFSNEFTSREINVPCHPEMGSLSYINLTNDKPVTIDKVSVIFTNGIEKRAKIHQTIQSHESIRILEVDNSFVGNTLCVSRIEVKGFSAEKKATVMFVGYYEPAVAHMSESTAKGTANFFRYDDCKESVSTVNVEATLGSRDRRWHTLQAQCGPQNALAMSVLLPSGTCHKLRVPMNMDAVCRIGEFDVF